MVSRCSKHSSQLVTGHLLSCFLAHLPPWSSSSVRLDPSCLLLCLPVIPEGTTHKCWFTYVLLKADTEGTPACVKFPRSTKCAGARAGVTLVARGQGWEPRQSASEQVSPDGQPLPLEPWSLVYQAAHICALFGPLDVRDGERDFSGVAADSTGRGLSEVSLWSVGDPSYQLRIASLLH